MMNSSQMAFGPPGGLRLRSLAAFKLDYVRTQAGEREDYFLGHAGVKLCDLAKNRKTRKAHHAVTDCNLHSTNVVSPGLTRSRSQAQRKRDSSLSHARQCSVELPLSLNSWD
jgi:hypothetical protein